MRNFLYILLLGWITLLPTWAQLSTDEETISSDPTFSSIMKARKVDLKNLPALDIIQLQKEDEQDEKNGIPPRFGYPHNVSFNLQNSGVWTVLPNGDKLWHLSIYCPKALSINLLYDKFHLPDKAKLFIYTNDRKNSIWNVSNNRSQS